MSTSLGPDTITDGLIFSIDAGNKKCYTTGTGVANTANNRFNGALTNGVSVTYDKLGEFTFDGVNDYISFTTSPLVFQSGASFTISYWLNVSNLSTVYSVVLSGNGPFNNGGNGLEVRYQTAFMECTVADGTGSGIRLQLDPAVTANQWNLFNFVYDRDTLWGAIYKNGVRVATQSYAGETTNTTAYEMYIGRGQDGYLQGKISSFTIHNRALNADEIYANYLATRSRYV